MAKRGPRTLWRCREDHTIFAYPAKRCFLAKCLHCREKHPSYGGYPDCKGPVKYARVDD